MSALYASSIPWRALLLLPVQCLVACLISQGAASRRRSLRLTNTTSFGASSKHEHGVLSLVEAEASLLSLVPITTVDVLSTDDYILAKVVRPILLVARSHLLLLVFVLVRILEVFEK